MIEPRRDEASRDGESLCREVPDLDGTDGSTRRRIEAADNPGVVAPATRTDEGEPLSLGYEVHAAGDVDGFSGPIPEVALPCGGAAGGDRR